jgi:hypothetical protein
VHGGGGACEWGGGGARRVVSKWVGLCTLATERQVAREAGRVGASVSKPPHAAFRALTKHVVARLRLALHVQLLHPQRQHARHGLAAEGVEDVAAWRVFGSLGVWGAFGGGFDPSAAAWRRCGEGRQPDHSPASAILWYFPKDSTIATVSCACVCGVIEVAGCQRGCPRTVCSVERQRADAPAARQPRRSCSRVRGAIYTHYSYLARAGIDDIAHGCQANVATEESVELDV